MIWVPTFFTARKGKYRLEVWQGYDGAWRASVHYGHQMMGVQGKRECTSLGAAKKYALKLLRLQRRNKVVRQ